MSWHWLQSTLLGEETVGPISDAEFAALVKDKSIKTATKVSHPQRTNGQWVEAGKLPVFKTLNTKFRAKEAEELASIKEAKQESAARAKQQKELKKQKDQVARDARNSERQTQRSIDDFKHSYVKAESKNSSIDGILLAVFGSLLCLVGLIAIASIDNFAGSICGTALFCTGCILIASCSVIWKLKEICNKLSARNRVDFWIQQNSNEQ